MAVPLLSEATPTPPTYPQTNVVVNPNGMRLTVVLGPGVKFATTLNEEVMNQICALWLQTRKDIADQMRFIEHVHQSKNN